MTESQENLATQSLQISAIVSEANILVRLGDYKAAECLYTKALEIQPRNVHLLCCRCRCHSLAENHLASLLDANAILEAEPGNSIAILFKADALFSQGDFENSLVWYYRGSKIRPDRAEYVSGIIKSQTAIESALNALQKIEMESQCGVVQMSKRSKRVQKHNLLEELFEDYAFLKKLERELPESVTGYIKTGIAYLDDRLEFWRGRNPLGANEPLGKPLNKRPVLPMIK
jgi:tetratricopeptide (TPR) repeat protein